MSVFQRTIEALENRKKALAAEAARALEQQAIEKAKYAARAKVVVDRVVARLNVEVAAIDASGGVANIRNQTFEGHFVVSLHFSFEQKQSERQDPPVFQFGVRVDGDAKVSLLAQAAMNRNSAYGAIQLGKLELIDLTDPAFDSRLDEALEHFYGAAYEYAEKLKRR